MELIKLGIKGIKSYHNKLNVSLVDGGLEISGTYDTFGKHFVIPPTRYEAPVVSVATDVWAFLVIDKATNEPVVIFDEVANDGVDRPYNFRTSELYEMVDGLLSFRLEPGVSLDDTPIQIYDRELPEENP